MCLDPLQGVAIPLDQAISAGHRHLRALQDVLWDEDKKNNVSDLRQTQTMLSCLEPFIATDGFNDTIAELDGQIRALQAKRELETEGFNREVAGLTQGLSLDWLPPHQPVALRCNHRFHSGCIHRWMHGASSARAARNQSLSLIHI